MPHHLTLTLWESYPDVGGCDAWLGSWWEQPNPNEDYSWQWFVGWHTPNALSDWSWPYRSLWFLIGHERWEYLHGSAWKSEGFYVTPNPSTTPMEINPTGTTNGHWHRLYARDGTVLQQTWTPNILDEGPLYLKGSKGKGEGKGKNKGGDGKGDDKGKGKGCYHPTGGMAYGTEGDGEDSDTD